MWGVWVGGESRLDGVLLPSQGLEEQRAAPSSPRHLPVPSARVVGRCGRVLWVPGGVGVVAFVLGVVVVEEEVPLC